MRKNNFQKSHFDQNSANILQISLTLNDASKFKNNVQKSQISSEICKNLVVASELFFLFFSFSFCIFLKFSRFNFVLSRRC